MAQEETQPTQTAEEEKTFTQKEVDDIIKKRLARVKNDTPADYDELKSKAQKFDELEEGNNADLQAMTKQLDELKASLAARDAADEERKIKQQISKQTGVPVDLISGKNEEEMAEFAQRVAEFAKKDTAPKSGHAGQFAKAGKAEDDMYRNIAKQIK